MFVAGLTCPDNILDSAKRERCTPKHLAPTHQSSVMSCTDNQYLLRVGILTPASGRQWQNQYLCEISYPF